MKDEVSVAVRFLTRLIEKSNASVTQGGIEKEQLEEKLQVFRERLGELLCERFHNHWFPEKPTRGQAYRCIRLNESDRKDAVIDQAAAHCGLSYDQLRLPTEITIWVDPKEVCCRFGEHQGSFCTLASFKNGSGEIFLDQVNLDEIHKKTLELREKVVQEMSTRKNGRRGFLANGSSPNNYKGSRFSNNNFSHHHSHHGHGLHHSNHSPSPAAVTWFNSVNSSNSSSNSNNNGNHHNQLQQQPHNVNINNHTSSMDMFTSSSSPPNHFSMYSLAKFSPPKYGYGTSSKWSTPPHPSSYGAAIGKADMSKGDKYHWFNANKATIKA